MDMTLASYFKRRDAMSASALAAKIGVSKARVSQLRDSRELPPELALAVERATDGAISASDLSPVIAEARRAA